jgi:hypothetical protein
METRVPHDKYSGVPAFRPPGPAFDARAAAKGKSMFIIPATSNVPFVTTIQNDMIKVGRSVGLKVTPWPNQGQPTQWVDGMNSAVTQHANLIDLEAGINPALVEPQIVRARKSGIDVTVAHFYGIGQKHAPNLSATMDIPYELGGELMADKVILDTNSKADALMLTVNQVLATVPLVKGIKNEFAKYCKGCKLSFIDRTIPDLPKYTSDVSTALIKDPVRDPEGRAVAGEQVGSCADGKAGGDPPAGEVEDDEARWRALEKECVAGCDQRDRRLVVERDRDRRNEAAEGVEEPLVDAVDLGHGSRVGTVDEHAPQVDRGGHARRRAGQRRSA